MKEWYIDKSLDYRPTLVIDHRPLNMEHLKMNRKQVKHFVLEFEQKTKRLLPNSLVCLAVVILVTLTVLLLMTLRRGKQQTQKRSPLLEGITSSSLLRLRLNLNVIGPKDS